MEQAPPGGEGLEMRVAHLADSHLDEKQDLEDNLRVHRVAIEQIREAKPDIILHAGDLHNRLSSPAVREAGLQIIDGLAEIAPVVLVRGNHDRTGDLLVYRGRRSTHPVHVFEKAGVAEFIVGDEPGEVDGRPQVRVRVLALPWIDKAQAAAQLEGSITETDDAVQRMISKLLETMRAWALPPADGITLGVGHVTIGGSVLSTGQTLIGKGLELNAGDLARAGAGLWALGHIHARQTFLDDRVQYSGSVQRLNFGEPEEKGWTLYELEHNPGAELGGIGVFQSTFQPLPARRIERYEWSLEMVREYLEREGPAGPDGIFSDDGSIAGARLRLRFPIRPDELAALDVDKLEAKLLAEGATQVKLEPILVHATRVRSEGITEVPTRFGQLKAWLDARGIDCPDQVLERRLEAKLAELEGEA